MDDLSVIWHDVECGGYAADLPLWRELATGGPVLDVGSGTGRVALDLARAGAEVHALDLDPVLLAALRERAAAGNLPVHAHEGDARDFDLGRTFPLVLAPMQTVQLLGGARGRAAFLRAARHHVAPGGLLACAIAEEIEPYDDMLWAPMPDIRELDGIVYSSRPIAVLQADDAFVLHRLRERVSAAGDREVSEDRTRLDALTAAGFEAEARAHGFTVEPRRTIAATLDHVASEVVVLRG